MKTYGPERIREKCRGGNVLFVLREEGESRIAQVTEKEYKAFVETVIGKEYECKVAIEFEGVDINILESDGTLLPPNTTRSLASYGLTVEELEELIIEPEAESTVHVESTGRTEQQGREEEGVFRKVRDFVSGDWRNHND